MAKVGRPSKFSDKVAEQLCSGLTDGKSLRSLCLQDDMPDQTTVFRWLADERYADFRKQYAGAREIQADAIFDECLDIADDGTDQHDGDHIARSRLRIDTRKWMAGKLAPKKYGEKLDIDVTGNITVQIVQFGDAP